MTEVPLRRPDRPHLICLSHHPAEAEPVEHQQGHQARRHRAMTGGVREEQS